MEVLKAVSSDTLQIMKSQSGYQINSRKIDILECKHN